jgi:UDP-GlcNAc:undecaprenyl-phosphate GlcNAc-1-phosphate transferase
LATGVGLFATVTTLIAALLGKNVPLAMATIPLAGALLGFLRYNFNPASIFLGDCGSLTVGFLLGGYAVLWSQKSATLLGMTAPLMVLAIPLLDTALAIVRRYLRGQPIFGADRGHIHHRLLARGMTPRRVALVLYAACGLVAALSLMASMWQNFTGLILVLFCALTWIGVQNLGYTEFGTAGRMVRAGAFRGLLNRELALGSFAEELRQAGNVEACWGAVGKAYQVFGFSAVHAEILGQVFTDAGAKNGRGAWQVWIPLPEGDYVMLTRSAESEVMALGGAAFAEEVSRTLGTRLSWLRGNVRVAERVEEMDGMEGLAEGAD